jgi:hypothetical protein
MSWHLPVIPAHGRLRQEDHKFEASLGYIATQGGVGGEEGRREGGKLGGRKEG